jgi:hypothetical protein
MKIKIGDKVTYLKREMTVTELKPWKFAVCTLEDKYGHEEYLLEHNLQEFIRENTQEATYEKTNQ